MINSRKATKTKRRKEIDESKTLWVIGLTIIASAFQINIFDKKLFAAKKCNDLNIMKKEFELE